MFSSNSVQTLLDMPYEQRETLLYALLVRTSADLQDAVERNQILEEELKEVEAQNSAHRTQIEELLLQRTQSGVIMSEPNDCYCPMCIKGQEEGCMEEEMGG